MIENTEVSFDFVCPECGQVIRIKVPFEEYTRWENYNDISELESITDKEMEILEHELCPDCIERHKKEDFPESIEISFDNVVLTRDELMLLYKENREISESPKDWIKKHFTKEYGYYNCWDIIEDCMDIETIKINK